MRSILSRKIETKISLTIIMIVVVIFLITIFKSIDSFNKFINKMSTYEEVRIEKGP